MLLAAAIAYFILQAVLVRIEGRDSPLGQATRNDIKGRATVVIYVVGISLSFLDGWIGVASYVIVALVWLVPDRRVERRLISQPER